MITTTEPSVNITTDPDTNEPSATTEPMFSTTRQPKVGNLHHTLSSVETRDETVSGGQISVY
ncbi:hypothetical protein TYRP_017645 [Tyrophagus putrescentiae]|nr:hypothetical protein TYRP_017645 [Tyrophagus putrescentiae]